MKRLIHIVIIFCVVCVASPAVVLAECGTIDQVEGYEQYLKARPQTGNMGPTSLEAVANWTGKIISVNEHIRDCWISESSSPDGAAMSISFCMRSDCSTNGYERVEVMNGSTILYGYIGTVGDFRGATKTNTVNFWAWQFAEWVKKTIESENNP